jgi:hypothetical protein
MLISQDVVEKAVAELTRGGRRFHSAELAEKLSKDLGTQVKSDTARYWANRFVIMGKLKRDQIHPKFYLYRAPQEADLPSSVTIKNP